MFFKLSVCITSPQNRKNKDNFYKTGFVNIYNTYILEACLYGDREGVVITYDGKKFTCSFEDIHDDPSVCYYVKDDCCRQCSHFYTGITG